MLKKLLYAITACTCLTVAAGFILFFWLVVFSPGTAINQNNIEKILSDYENVEFTKTENRSVLGNLNELVSLYKHNIYYDHGLKYCDLTNIIHRVNRMPQRNIGWKYSIDAVNELLKRIKGA